MADILVGPFAQVLTMAHLPVKGRLADEALEVVGDAGITVADGLIQDVGAFDDLAQNYKASAIRELDEPMVCLPGLVDCHTHICFAGSRARDYAMRVAGKPYLEIAQAGGGILDTVARTRGASREELERALADRCDRHLDEGVTTCEIKSGYGLNVADELKMLHAIDAIGRTHAMDIVATCLAAHMPPKDADPAAYLAMICNELLPQVFAGNLSQRVDIFIEESAFSLAEARPYLLKARKIGFELTMHVDQFTAGSSRLAVELGALSADHLEASTDKEIQALAQSDVVAVALPGASLGLGCNFTPARKFLDAGACLAIATDWNPGSAPMGDLLLQGAVLGAAQKLTTVETFAAMTFRAANALALADRGRLTHGLQADFIAFPTDDYREILYHQGKMKPAAVWKRGERMVHGMAG